MKKLVFVLAALLSALGFCACAPDSSSGGEHTTEDTTVQLYFTIGETKLSATLEENAATEKLKEKLSAAPVTLQMSDYGGWEKVGGFGFTLPASDENFTAKPCDFVLYQGDKLVIFYGTNSWSYTRLGRITGVTKEELKGVLGNGDVSVTLSLN